MNLSGEKASNIEMFRSAIKAIFDLCPDSVPSSSTVKSKICGFEGMFGQTPRQSKDDVAPKAFHRVSEVLSEVRTKFSEVIASGKGLSVALPHCKKLYRVAEAPELGESSSLNRDIPQVGGECFLA